MINTFPLKPPVKTPPIKVEVKPDKPSEAIEKHAEPTPPKPRPIRFWLADLNKFLHQEVVVTYVLGTIVCTVEGRLSSFSPDAFNVCVDTDAESIAIRLPLEIRRKRKGTSAGAADASL